MTILADIAVAIVALLHGYFMILEMWLWDQPAGLKIFGQTRQQAAATKVLAANQGLYNGFIAAGLAYGLLRGAAGGEFVVFFLLCIIVAGVFGALTANRKILFVQALPGLLALLLTILTR